MWLNYRLTRQEEIEYMVKKSCLCVLNRFLDKEYMMKKYDLFSTGQRRNLKAFIAVGGFITMAGLLLMIDPKDTKNLVGFFIGALGILFILFVLSRIEDSVWSIDLARAARDSRREEKKKLETRSNVKEVDVVFRQYALREKIVTIVAYIFAVMALLFSLLVALGYLPPNARSYAAKSNVHPAVERTIAAVIGLAIALIVFFLPRFAFGSRFEPVPSDDEWPDIIGDLSDTIN
jgi:cell division protein FtsW (lipid II flippase)